MISKNASITLLLFSLVLKINLESYLQCGPGGLANLPYYLWHQLPFWLSRCGCNGKTIIGNSNLTKCYPFQYKTITQLWCNQWVLGVRIEDCTYPSTFLHEVTRLHLRLKLATLVVSSLSFLLLHKKTCSYWFVFSAYESFEVRFRPSMLLIFLIFFMLLVPC